ncbi:MAG TPA: SDR family NAD(P)-dependent oxidoreductase [Chthoniobacterales bacterium]|jgi:adenosylhomocysteine nucleosidase
MDNVSSLLDKRTLITGASRGIGAAIARKLAKAGADIAMTYKRSTDKAGGRTLRSKGSLFTGWTGRPMKPVARALRVFAASIFIGPFWAQRGSSAEFDRIAIVSAFDPELMAIEQAIIPKKVENKIEEVNGTRVCLVDLYGKHLYFFLSGMSMVNAALTAQMAIDHFELDAIIFAGIAGAVDPTLHPGDVVVPAYWIHQMESVWSNPDSTKSGSYVLPEFYRPKYGHFEMIFPNDVQVVRKGDAKIRQVHAFPADRYLLGCAESAANRVRLVDAEGEPRSVYIGGNAMSGPVFLDNRAFREFAFRTWKVRLHEMEGTAIAQVGYVNRVPVLIVRGISDLAGGQHGQNSEETYTRLASRNAALVAAATLNKLIGR